MSCIFGTHLRASGLNKADLSKTFSLELEDLGGFIIFRPVGLIMEWDEVDISNFIDGISFSKPIIFDLGFFQGGILDHSLKLKSVVSEACEKYNNLHSQPENCHFVSYVGNYGQCISSCIPLFMQFQRRVAHPNAKFGFHALQVYRFFLPNKVEPVESAIEKLAEFNIYTSWLQKNSEIFKSVDVTYLNSKDLNGSNVITETILKLNDVLIN